MDLTNPENRKKSNRAIADINKFYKVFGWDYEFFW